jgi:hypothetical protein
MKKLLTIILSAFVLSASAQVYNVPVTVGDTVIIKNGTKTLLSFPAQGLDSAYRFTLEKFFKVPPPPPVDTLKILSVSVRSGTSMLTHTVAAPSGSMIVITTASAGSGNNCGIGGSATIIWSKNADAQASNSGDAEIFTSIVSGGTYTITTDYGSVSQASAVYVIVGAEGVGAKGVTIAQAAPLLNITTTKSGSILIGVTADYNGRDGNTRVYRDNASEKLYARAVDKSGTSYHYLKSASVIKSYTEGLSTPSTMAAGTAFVEIKAKSGSIFIDSLPPSAPSITVSTITTSSIDLSWTTSVDNVAVSGYDVFLDGIFLATTGKISYSITGLAPATTHKIYVVARDSTGNKSQSNTITASTQQLPNQAPVASAGPDVSMTLPANSTVLNGGGSKDPDGTIVFYKWSYLSGPSQWLIGDASQASTTLGNLAEGTYVFRLQVTDDRGDIAVDDISIVVNPAPVVVDTSGKIEGFGANAVGGSQSTLVKYVSTQDEFDKALGSNRTILFTKDITFTDRVYISSYSYLTVDGNGFDVTIDNGNNGDGFSIDGASAHHIIVKGIRVINAGGDGINVVGGAHDVAIINCSSYDNRDGNIDVAGDNAGVTKNITVQYCFIGRGKAKDPSYSGDQLITGQNVSSHHNFFAPATDGEVGERAPLVHCNYSPVGSPNADVRNNLVWKFGRNNATGSGYGADIAYSATANVVNNYYYSPSDGGNAVVTNGSYGSTPKGSAYVAGNVSGNAGVNPNNQSNHAEYSIPAQYAITMQPTCEAARIVISKAGMIKKTPYEQSVINEVATLPGCPVK